MSYNSLFCTFNLWYFLNMLSLSLYVGSAQYFSTKYVRLLWGVMHYKL